MDDGSAVAVVGVKRQSWGKDEEVYRPEDSPMMHCMCRCHRLERCHAVVVASNVDVNSAGTSNKILTYFIC